MTPQPDVPILCPACERGEKTITPPHISIVGSMPVHFPSGSICIASPEYQKLKERIRERNREQPR